MSFPISAALLDAIVLSVVAQEPEGTYGYKITQQVTHTLELSESTLYRCCAGCRKTNCSRSMMRPSMAATAAIIRSPPPGGSSLPPMPRSGAATVLPLTHFSERWNDL